MKSILSFFVFSFLYLSLAFSSAPTERTQEKALDKAQENSLENFQVEKQASAISIENRKLDLSVLPLQLLEIYQQEIPKLKTDKWTLPELDQLIRLAVGRGDFDFAEFEFQASSNTYKLKVSRKKIISKIRLWGNKTFSDSELKTVFGNLEETEYDSTMIKEAGLRLSRFYLSSGYRRMSEDINVIPLESGNLELLIKIDEGEPTLIKSIEVISGNTQFKENTQKFLKKWQGNLLSNLTLEEMKRTSRDFFSKGRFYKTELPEPTSFFKDDETEVVLKFNIDQSLEYIVNLEGNNKVSDSTLYKNLKIDDYFSTHSELAQEFANKIKNYYLTSGYARVQVQSEELSGFHPYQRRIELKIDEGDLIKIESISFSGQLSLPVEEYENLLKEFSSDLILDKIYVKEDFDAALNNLKIQRQNQGYLRTRIVSTRVVYNKDKNKVNIYVNFDEGPLTKVEKVTFEGNIKEADLKLIKIVKIYPGQALKLNEFEEAIQNLKNYYRGLGYLEMELENEKSESETEGPLQYKSNNTLVHVHFKIKEGPKIIVASILVEGNTLTKEKVILKELEFKRGDVLTQQDIEESTIRLQRLGHFNSVDIRTLEEKTKISKRTVIVKVIDRNPGLFEMGLGFNNERQFTLRGYMGLSYRNIYGTGRGLSGRIDGKYNLTEVRYPEFNLAIGYLEPYIFNTRMRGRVNFTRAISVSDFDARKASSITQASYTLEQNITAHLLVAWDLLNIANVKDFNIDSGYESDVVNIATTGPNIDIDYRDQPFNPSKGSLVRFNFEYGNPALGSSASIEFYRAFANFSYYTPLPKKGWVLANSLRGGYLINLSPFQDGELADRKAGVPYDKKGITLGGQSTIRGFALDEAFPNHYEFFPQCTSACSDTYYLTTDAKMYLIKTELRFPITKFNNWDFGAALFYDGGAVIIRDLHYSTPSYRHSAGIALRINLPVGAIGLDFGWKLNPQASRRENPLVVGLEVGTF